MPQPCRAGLGRNFPLITNLSSGNKKYIILPPTKGYTAPKSAVHFLSTGSHGMAAASVFNVCGSSARLCVLRSLAILRRLHSSVSASIRTTGVCFKRS